jgi:hypothetical protein
MPEKIKTFVWSLAMLFIASLALSCISPVGGGGEPATTSTVITVATSWSGIWIEESPLRAAGKSAGGKAAFNMDDIARAFINDSFVGVGNTDTPSLLERTQQKADEIAHGTIAALRMVPVIPGRTSTWVLSKYNSTSPELVPLADLDERVLNKLRDDGKLSTGDTTVNLKDYVDEYR